MSQRSKIDVFANDANWQPSRSLVRHLFGRMRLRTKTLMTKRHRKIEDEAIKSLREMVRDKQRELQRLKDSLEAWLIFKQLRKKKRA